MKKKKRKKSPDLRIDSNDEALVKKWSPRLTEQKNQISRPSDIVKRFRVGLTEVLLKLSQLLPEWNLDERTKLPEQTIKLIEANGDDPNFWPTLKKQEKKNSPIHPPVKSKTKKKTYKKSGKKKKKGSVHPILTPVNGQPGYKIGRRYK